jgi:hypothetical protein
VAFVTAASVGLVVAVGGLGGLSAMTRAVGFQFGRVSGSSPWVALGVPRLQPIAEAGALSLVVGATVRVCRGPSIGEDIQRLGAIAAAVLLSMQLAAKDWDFRYLAWVLPLLTLSLLTSTSVAAADAEVAESLVTPTLVPGT